MRPITDPYVRLTDGMRVTPDGCWLSALTPKASGYVRIWADGRSVAVHRFAYEFWNGPIPTGMTVDHACHDPATCPPGPCPHRGCFNPDHLVLASMRDNVLRGGGPSARNAAAAKCVHGHPLVGDNLIITPQGWRMCRECGRHRSREYARRKRAGAVK